MKHHDSGNVESDHQVTRHPVHRILDLLHSKHEQQAFPLTYQSKKVLAWCLQIPCRRERLVMANLVTKCET